MEAKPSPKITDAERVDGGVAISFDGGRSAFYSSEFLYGVIDEAREIFTCNEEE